MPLINNPSLGLRLKKFCQLTALPDSVLAPEIVGTILLGDLTEGATDRLCMGSRSIQAAGGQFPLVGIRNQPAAGAPRDVAVRVTRIWVTTDTTQLITIAFTGAGLGAWSQGQKAFLDLDQVGAPSTEVGGDGEVAEPADARLAEIRLLANTVLEFPINFLMGTVNAGLFQNSLFVFGFTADTNISATFAWTEFSPDPE